MKLSPHNSLYILSFKHLFLALLILHLLPIWIYRYFPSQDGMNHVYNAYILKSYHHPGFYKTREIFQLNLTFFPNWISHLLMAGLMFIVPPLIAEKLLLTLCVAGVPLAFLYFSRSIDQESTFNAWLGFLFSYHYLLHMGFYNFALSFALFFIVIGYWWRNRHAMAAEQIGVLYLMLILLYFCHIVSYALTLMVIAVSAILTLRCLKPMIVCVGYMMPAGFLLFNYLLDSTQGALPQYESSGWIWEYLWKNRSLLVFNDDFLWANLVLLGLVVTLILYTIWTDKTLTNLIRRRTPILEKDIFLLMAVIFLLLFCNLPRFVGSGGWINERIHLFLVPLLLPWLTTRFHRIIKHIIAGCWILLSLVHLGYTCRDMSVYNREMSEFARVMELPDHTIFKRLDADHWGALTKYALPYFNGFVSYGFSGDRAYIHNYEAEFDYFPVNFKGNNNRDHYDGDPIPYRIGWNLAKDSQNLRPFLQDYDLIYSRGSLKVLRHKLFAPAKERVWDQLATETGMMQFTMGDLQNPQPGTYLVPPGLRYRPGGYGWDTLSPRQVFDGGVRDSEDAAFVIDLPNGKYRIRFQFQSDMVRSHRISLYANGKRLGAPVIVPMNQAIVEKIEQVETSNNRLTLVIHSLDKGVDAYWIWRGCTIEKVG